MHAVHAVIDERSINWHSALYWRSHSRLVSYLYLLLDPAYILYQGYRQASGEPFKGFHWIPYAEDLTSRFEARAPALPTNVKVEPRGKYGGLMAGQDLGEYRRPLS